MLTKEEIKELTSVRNQMVIAVGFLESKINNFSHISSNYIGDLKYILNSINSEIQRQNHHYFKEENYIENIINEVK